jgi:dienelactone hydrolase
MGEMPPSDKQVPLDIQIDGETDCGVYTQYHLTYATEPWDRTPALLLVPKEIAGKAPAMIALHQTWTDGKAIVADRNGSLPHLEYGRELAERGYVVLAADYPGFGEYVDCRKALYENGYVSCTLKGIWNHMRGVDLLQSLDYVDPSRIGAIGHSLGGHNTLFLAAFDDRIQVAVTSCGFTNFAYYYGGDLTGWSHDGYMPRIATEYGKNPAAMPFDFSEVLAAIAPRAVFVNAPVGDANFDVTGVHAAVRMAQPAFTITGAKHPIVSRYPDAEHDFPDSERMAAYAFIDTVLKAGD